MSFLIIIILLWYKFQLSKYRISAARLAWADFPLVFIFLRLPFYIFLVLFLSHSFFLYVCACLVYIRLGITTRLFVCACVRVSLYEWVCMCFLNSLFFSLFSFLFYPSVVICVLTLTHTTQSFARMKSSQVTGKAEKLLNKHFYYYLFKFKWYELRTKKNYGVNDGWLCVDLIIFASVYPEFHCNQFISRYWSHEKCILNESFLLLKMVWRRMKVNEEK